MATSVAVGASSTGLSPSTTDSSIDLRLQQVAGEGSRHGQFSRMRMCTDSNGASSKKELEAILKNLRQSRSNLDGAACNFSNGPASRNVPSERIQPGGCVAGTKCRRASLSVTKTEGEATPSSRDAQAMRKRLQNYQQLCRIFSIDDQPDIVAFLVAHTQEFVSEFLHDIKRAMALSEAGRRGTTEVHSGRFAANASTPSSDFSTVPCTRRQADSLALLLLSLSVRSLGFFLHHSTLSLTLKGKTVQGVIQTLCNIVQAMKCRTSVSLCLWCLSVSQVPSGIGKDLSYVVRAIVSGLENVWESPTVLREACGVFSHFLHTFGHELCSYTLAKLWIPPLLFLCASMNESRRRRAMQMFIEAMPFLLASPPKTKSIVVDMVRGKILRSRPVLPPSASLSSVAWAGQELYKDSVISSLRKLLVYNPSSEAAQRNISKTSKVQGAFVPPASNTAGPSTPGVKMAKDAVVIWGLLLVLLRNEGVGLGSEGVNLLLKVPSKALVKREDCLRKKMIQLWPLLVDFFTTCEPTFFARRSRLSVLKAPLLLLSSEEKEKNWQIREEAFYSFDYLLYSILKLCERVEHGESQSSPVVENENKSSLRAANTDDTFNANMKIWLEALFLPCMSRFLADSNEHIHKKAESLLSSLLRRESTQRALRAVKANKSTTVIGKDVDDVSKGTEKETFGVPRRHRSKRTLQDHGKQDDVQTRLGWLYAKMQSARYLSSAGSSTSSDLSSSSTASSLSSSIASSASSSPGKGMGALSPFRFPFSACFLYTCPCGGREAHSERSPAMTNEAGGPDCAEGSPSSELRNSMEENKVTERETEKRHPVEKKPQAGKKRPRPRWTSRHGSEDSSSSPQTRSETHKSETNTRCCRGELSMGSTSLFLSRSIVLEKVTDFLELMGICIWRELKTSMEAFIERGEGGGTVTHSENLQSYVSGSVQTSAEDSGGANIERWKRTLDTVCHSTESLLDIVVLSHSEQGERGVLSVESERANFESDVGRDSAIVGFQSPLQYAGGHKGALDDPEENETSPVPTYSNADLSWLLYISLLLGREAGKSDCWREDKTFGSLSHASSSIGSFLPSIAGASNPSSSSSSNSISSSCESSAFLPNFVLANLTFVIFSSLVRRLKTKPESMLPAGWIRRFVDDLAKSFPHLASNVRNPPPFTVLFKQELLPLLSLVHKLLVSEYQEEYECFMTVDQRIDDEGKDKSRVDGSEMERAGDGDIVDAVRHDRRWSNIEQVDGPETKVGQGDAEVGFKTDKKGQSLVRSKSKKNVSFSKKTQSLAVVGTKTESDELAGELRGERAGHVSLSSERKILCASLRDARVIGHEDGPEDDLTEADTEADTEVEEDSDCETAPTQLDGEVEPMAVVETRDPHSASDTMREEASATENALVAETRDHSNVADTALGKACSTESVSVAITRDPLVVSDTMVLETFGPASSSGAEKISERSIEKLQVEAAAADKSSIGNAKEQKGIQVADCEATPDSEVRGELNLSEPASKATNASKCSQEESGLGLLSSLRSARPLEVTANTEVVTQTLVTKTGVEVDMAVINDCAFSREKEEENENGEVCEEDSERVKNTVAETLISFAQVRSAGSMLSISEGKTSDGGYNEKQVRCKTDQFFEGCKSICSRDRDILRADSSENISNSLNRAQQSREEDGTVLSALRTTANKVLPAAAVDRMNSSTERNANRPQMLETEGKVDTKCTTPGKSTIFSWKKGEYQSKRGRYLVELGKAIGKRKFSGFCGEVVAAGPVTTPDFSRDVKKGRFGRQTRVCASAWGAEDKEVGQLLKEKMESLKRDSRPSWNKQRADTTGAGYVEAGEEGGELTLNRLDAEQLMKKDLFANTEVLSTNWAEDQESEPLSEIHMNEKQAKRRIVYEESEQMKLLPLGDGNVREDQRQELCAPPGGSDRMYEGDTARYIEHSEEAVSKTETSTCVSESPCAIASATSNVASGAANKAESMHSSHCVQPTGKCNNYLSQGRNVCEERCRSVESPSKCQSQAQVALPDLKGFARREKRVTLLLESGTSDVLDGVDRSQSPARNLAGKSCWRNKDTLHFKVRTPGEVTESQETAEMERQTVRAKRIQEKTDFRRRRGRIEEEPHTKIRVSSPSHSSLMINVSGVGQESSRRGMGTTDLTDGILRTASAVSWNRTSKRREGRVGSTIIHQGRNAPVLLSAKNRTNIGGQSTPISREPASVAALTSVDHDESISASLKTMKNRRVRRCLTNLLDMNVSTDTRPRDTENRLSLQITGEQAASHAELARKVATTPTMIARARVLHKYHKKICSAGKETEGPSGGERGLLVVRSIEAAVKEGVQALVSEAADREDIISLMSVLNKASNDLLRLLKQQGGSEKAETGAS